MAEITKITTPLMPRENVGNKYKPDTDQALEFNDLSKVHKPAQEGRVFDRQPDNQTLLRESMGRAAIQAILKDSGELVGVVKRLALLIETGVSSTQTMNDPAMKELLDSLFLNPRQITDTIAEQDKASVLFKGEAFNVLRDLLGKFEDNPKIRNAVANLLKVFEHNVSSNSSIKSILSSCANILDYMFTRDREQFTEYLDGLARMLLPAEDLPANVGAQTTQAQAQAQAQTQAPQTQAQQTQAQQTQNPTETETLADNIPAGAQRQTEQPVPPGTAEANRNAQATLTDTTEAFEEPVRQVLQQEQQATRQDGNSATPQPQLSQREAAQILKGNLLPLLGEIVVKYHQNNKIRDHVMTVVHNIVRVDQGTPEALRDAVKQLVQQLRQVANVPDSFAQNLLKSLTDSSEQAQEAQNGVMEKLSGIVSEALRSEDSSPAVLRQAENLLMSMLQNQSTMMNVLHFVLPLQTANDQIFAELYVDPDNGSDSSKQGGKESRKFFLSFESANYGAFELSFVQTGEHVDFAMWCPGPLVKGLGGLKRYFSDIMQTYGYTMSSFQIDELRRPQSVADVFPKLLEKRVGIDVRV